MAVVVARLLSLHSVSDEQSWSRRVVLSMWHSLLRRMRCELLQEP